MVVKKYVKGDKRRIVGDNGGGYTVRGSSCLVLRLSKEKLGVNE